MIGSVEKERTMYGGGRGGGGGNEMNICLMKSPDKVVKYFLVHSDGRYPS